VKYTLFGEEMFKITISWVRFFQTVSSQPKKNPSMLSIQSIALEQGGRKKAYIVTHEI